MDPTISVAWVGLLGIVFAGVLGYLRFWQKRKDKKETDQQDEDSKIVALMVDQFEGLQAEVKTSRGEVKASREDIDVVWNQVKKLQRDNWDCEKRCAELSREVQELKNLVTDLKLQVARQAP